MADVQRLEDLIQKGLELFRAKRFFEAEPLFRQALMVEPRHTGAAYMLAVSLYFSGEFPEALHLFRQLTAPGSPLEAQQMSGLQELAGYANFELLRQKYWDGLRLRQPQKIEKEMRRRKWDPVSLEAFHLYLINGKAAEWSANYRRPRIALDARITTRANRIMILEDCRDADDTIGTHIEAVQGGAYVFLPLSGIKTLEFGAVKRWMTAQIEYQDSRRDNVIVPLTYRGSMRQKARGVQEGVETIFCNVEGAPDVQQAFGQKQWQSATGRVGWAEVLRVEIIGRAL